MLKILKDAKILIEILEARSMSLVSGIFTLPYSYVRLAYQQTSLKFSLEERSDLGSETICKGDSRYAEVLKKLPGSHLKADMQPFLDKSGVRKDLIFFETPNIGLCSAVGTNRFTKGAAIIRVAPGFCEADKEACSWSMKHEISHVKNDDLFLMYSVRCICQLAASFFGMSCLSFFPAIGLAWTVGIVSQALFIQRQEARADDFAIENSSNEELQGGRRFLIAAKEVTLQERNTFWKRIIISVEGNDRSDILHPSITSRIHKVEKALRARNINVPAEKGKIESLKQYVMTLC